MVEVLFFSVLLAILAFFLGACPFSLWIGWWLLGQDIRDYGDGNPGAVNVFKAGGVRVGFLAVLFEAGKGFPFVYLAQSYFKLPEVSFVVVATCALLGHAFSPILRFKGGKALAVTLGVLLALPHYEILIAIIAFTCLGFLFIRTDAWIVIFGATGSFVYFVITKGISWEPLILLCILAVWVIKHFADLQVLPGLKLRPVVWLRSKGLAK
jgi:glycerol-3-phosphate acyltransferase PlsY